MVGVVEIRDMEMRANAERANDFETLRDRVSWATAGMEICFSGSANGLIQSAVGTGAGCLSKLTLRQKERISAAQVEAAAPG
jgi:hypothetical protein